MKPHIKTRPRLFFSIFVACALWMLLPDTIRQASRLLVSFDTATGMYLLLVTWMMKCSTPATIQKHADDEDEGRTAILIFSSIVAVASLAAIIAELSVAKDMAGMVRGEHIALAAGTVFLSWNFLHSIFALHYAHEYYTSSSSKTSGGLEFPGGGNYMPNYWDFMYFSWMIGTTGATADVNIASPAMRRTATLHCMLSFFFNTTILALTVNIGASLF